METLCGGAKHVVAISGRWGVPDGDRGQAGGIIREGRTGGACLGVGGRVVVFRKGGRRERVVRTRGQRSDGYSRTGIHAIESKED